jgi:transposase
METNEISHHQVRTFLWLEKTKGWRSNREIAKGANISERTARMFTARWVALGILDQAEVFPGHRYRLSDQAENRNKSYVLRIREAASVFAE